MEWSIRSALVSAQHSRWRALGDCGKGKFTAFKVLQLKLDEVWLYVEMHACVTLSYSATLYRDVPFSAIYWPCYELFKGLTLSEEHQERIR